MAVLVDSDVLIDAGRSERDAVNFLGRVGQTDTIFVSTITQMELMVGARNKNELRIVERFLARFTIVKLNPTIADLAVDLIRQYRLSHGLLMPDALIAATALSINESLATKNQRDYRFIAGLVLAPYP